MWLVCGLGNPGTRYANTPHNLGFEVVDELARRWRLSFAPRDRWRALVAEGDGVHLVKPVTYMNCSGEAIVPYATYRQIEPANILSITDDIHLDLGRLRLRPDGSHGGHNGLRDIIAHLGGQGFPRLRLGCRPSGVVVDDWVSFVLGHFRPESRQVANLAVDAAADCVEMILRDGIEKAMQAFNGRRFGEAP